MHENTKSKLRDLFKLCFYEPVCLIENEPFYPTVMHRNKTLLEFKSIIFDRLSAPYG